MEALVDDVREGEVRREVMDGEGVIFVSVAHEGVAVVRGQQGHGQVVDGEPGRQQIGQ